MQHAASLCHCSVLIKTVKDTYRYTMARKWSRGGMTVKLIEQSPSHTNPQTTLHLILSTAVISAVSLLALTLSIVRRRRFFFLARQQKKSVHSPQRSSENGSISPSPSASPSSRGQATKTKSVIPYIQRHIVAVQDLYDAKTNPRGHISLAIAENKLVLDLISNRFMRVASCTAAFLDTAAYHYNYMTGMPCAREAAAYFLARRFWGKTNVTTRHEAAQLIDPSHVILGAGCAPLINNLFFLLGEQGDCCLIPAPYYAAFENYMSIVAGVIPYAVHQDHPDLGPTGAELSRAHEEATRQGLNPRFLLLTNPNNPLGCIYNANVIETAIEWARERDMHIVVDEIYAMSPQDGCEFQSVIKILDNELGRDVHMLWAMSKDFGASGVRYGLLYTQNELFLQGLSSINAFCCASGPIQNLVADLLLDDEFLDRYFDESRRRLRKSYKICTNKLDELGLSFVSASAGIFVYTDLSSLLPEPTFEWEDRLSRVLLDYARLVFTPGESQRDQRPGMFRICYAWVAPEVLAVAMERLGCLVAKIRQSGGLDNLEDSCRESILLGSSVHFI